MLRNILHLLYPPVCGICGKIGKEYICPKCNIKLKKLEIGKIDYYPNGYFTNHFYLFRYEGIIRKKIIEFKFQDKSYLYEFFVKILLNHPKISGLLEKYDIILPVPMYVKKQKKRGYNQTELITKELAKHFKNLIYEGETLKKVIDTKTQSSLNKTERRNNIKNVYKVEDIQKINGKKIVLLDDIYTTGATVKECSKVLKKAGAKEILIVTLAKD